MTLICVNRLKENFKALDGEKQDLNKRCDDLGQRLAQSENTVQHAQTKVTEAENNAKNHQELLMSQLRDKDLEIQVMQQ